MGEDNKRAVLIAGPTASGKSALALALAERLDGVIINADSMQVYAELQILTARPDTADIARAPHRLYGHIPAAEGYTVARWLSDVEAALTAVNAEGRTPILVGGTGLYFNAVTQGLSPVPPVPDAVRHYWREGQADRATPDLHLELQSRDPASAARLSPNDRQRILRSLEVVDATGRSLTDWQQERTEPLITHHLGLVIAPERELLRQRIADRFRIMVETGGLEEANLFAALGLDPALPAMKAIGVPEMMAAASGRVAVDVAVETAITATRQYAKRQETWFRNQMPDWKRLEFGLSGNILKFADKIAQQMK